MDEDGDAIVCIFAQCDGFLEDFGQEVVNFVVQRSVVNGLRDDNTLASNGLTELAAHLVVALKRDTMHGHIYLVPAKSKWDWAYRYTISPPQKSGSLYVGSGGDLRIVVEDVLNTTGKPRKMYDGKVSGYAAFLQSLQHEEV